MIQGGESNWEGESLKIYFLLVGRVEKLMLESNLYDGDHEMTQSVVLWKRRGGRTVRGLDK